MRPNKALQSDAPALASRKDMVTPLFQRLAQLACFVAITSCATEPTGPRIDNVPMYGQPEIVRPAFLRQADEDFIKKASAGFGSREEASNVWYAQGERFFRELNFDYAMRRYNQAWLLNPNNYQPYWGFARVLVQTDRPSEAIRHIEKAKSLCDDNYQKVALISDAAAAYSYAGTYQRANEYFQESTTLDPKYEAGWYRWSQSLYREGKYAEAWSKLKQARLLGAKVSEAYVAELSQKMPEPQ